MIRKGEVYEIAPGRLKGVVVSGDAMTTGGGLVWIVPISRHIPEALPDLLAVSTHETDPVSGVVPLMELIPISSGFLTEPVGGLVGTTMAKIDDGLRAMFDL